MHAEEYFFNFILFLSPETKKTEKFYEIIRPTGSPLEPPVCVQSNTTLDKRIIFHSQINRLQDEARLFIRKSPLHPTQDLSWGKSPEGFE